VVDGVAQYSDLIIKKNEVKEQKTLGLSLRGQLES
jgi:hypothetical protein